MWCVCACVHVWCVCKHVRVRWYTYVCVSTLLTLVHTILPSLLPLPYPSPPSSLPSTPHRVSNAVKPPKELVVKVDLAGVRTVTDVELEVFERRLELHSQNPVYKLEVGVVKCVWCGVVWCGVVWCGVV